MPISRSSGSRSVIPIDPDQGGGVSAPLDAFLISVLGPGVKHGGARPRSQQEGPARDAECPHGWRSGARGSLLLTTGTGYRCSTML